jgi:hypothetical protein
MYLDPILIFYTWTNIQNSAQEIATGEFPAVLCYLLSVTTKIDYSGSASYDLLLTQNPQ